MLEILSHMMVSLVCISTKRWLCKRCHCLQCITELSILQFSKQTHSECKGRSDGRKKLNIASSMVGALYSWNTGISQKLKHVIITGCSYSHQRELVLTRAVLLSKRYDHNNQNLWLQLQPPEGAGPDPGCGPVKGSGHNNQIQRAMEIERGMSTWTRACIQYFMV